MKLEIQMAISYFPRNSQEHLEPLVDLYHKASEMQTQLAQVKYAVSLSDRGKEKIEKTKVIPI